MSTICTISTVFFVVISLKIHLIWKIKASRVFTSQCFSYNPGKPSQHYFSAACFVFQCFRNYFFLWKPDWGKFEGLREGSRFICCLVRFSLIIVWRVSWTQTFRVCLVPNKDNCVTVCSYRHSIIPVSAMTMLT